MLLKIIMAELIPFVITTGKKKKPVTMNIK